jgi:thiamine transport system permease protein
VFLYAFSGFGLALVLGGQRYATIEVEIYTLVAHELQLAQPDCWRWLMLLLTGAGGPGVCLLRAAAGHPRRADAYAAQLRARLAGPGGPWVLALATLGLCVRRRSWRSCCRWLAAGSAAWAVLAGTADAAWRLWNTVRFTVGALVLATCWA